VKIAVYHNLTSGGAKRALYETARRLAGRHELRVYSLSSADHDFCDLRENSAAHRIWPFRPLPLLRSPAGRLNQTLRWLDLKRLAVVGGRLARAIEQDGCDVALVHPCQFEGSPTVLSRLRGAPTVYYCHEPLRRLYERMPDRPYDRPRTAVARALDRLDPFPTLYRRALRRVDRANLRAADLVLVNSQFIREAVWTIYQVEADVCYQGVDTAMFRPLGLSRSPDLLSVGSLTPLKGFDFLIRSLARIPAGQRPILRLASNFSNPMEQRYLTALSEEAGVGLHLLGGVSDTALVRLYNEVSATAYAPVREPFGLVPLESMACGTVVVGVREGGVAESVEDGLGVLVDRDEDAFAGAVQEILAEPSRRTALAARARATVERRWTWQQAVDRLEAHLAAVV
jgi:glycosyltransferase involved in cell wall biosynthesis